MGLVFPSPVPRFLHLPWLTRLSSMRIYDVEEEVSFQLKKNLECYQFLCWMEMKSQISS